MLSYTIKVSICWLCFYLLFHCFLRKETYFRLNRSYLLTSLSLGLLIPTLEVSIPAASIQQQVFHAQYIEPVVVGIEAFETIVEVRPDQRYFKPEELLRYLYWTGFSLLSLRLLIGITRIGTLVRTGRRKREGNHILIFHSRKIAPFSCFNLLFFNEDFKENQTDLEKIKKHEMAHADGWHSLDVFFLEILSIVFWFNPLIYFFKSSLRLQHEFIADASTIKNMNKTQYGHLLIRQSLSGNVIALANHFSLQLKKRFTMMKRKRSKPLAYLKYAFAIPMTALLLMAFAGKNKMKPEDYLNGLQESKFNLMHEFNPKEIKQLLLTILDGQNTTVTNKDDETIDGKFLMSVKMGQFAQSYRKLLETFPGKAAELETMAKEAAEEFEVNLILLDTETLRYSYQGQINNSMTGGNTATGVSDITVGIIVLKDGTKLSYTVESEDKFPKGFPQDQIERVDLKFQDGKNLMVIFMKEGVTKELFTKWPAIKETKHQKVLTEVEQLPLFGDCDPTLEGKELQRCSDRNMLMHIYKNIKYPSSARDAGIQGTVVVKFIIDEQGQVRDPFIVRAIGGGCDDEVLKIINEMPAWKPAIDENKPVEFEFTLPVRFKIDDNKTTEKAFTEVDEMPRFPGCDENTMDAEELKNCSNRKLIAFIQKNIQYPTAAKEKGIEGMAILKFVVEKNGRLSSFKVERDESEAFGHEVMRIGALLPAFTPGKKDGKTVRTVINLPIKFALPKEETGSIGMAEKLELRYFKASPNPTTDQVQLSFQGEVGTIRLSVTDLTGQQVYSFEDNQFDGFFNGDVDLSNYPTGPYFLRVTQNNKAFTYKIVKQ